MLSRNPHFSQVLSGHSEFIKRILLSLISKVTTGFVFSVKTSSSAEAKSIRLTSLPSTVITAVGLSVFLPLKNIRKTETREEILLQKQL